MTKAVYEGEVTNYIVDITSGKEYDTIDVTDTSFRLIDDEGTRIYCLWEGCAHLGGGNWTRVED